MAKLLLIALLVTLTANLSFAAAAKAGKTQATKPVIKKDEGTVTQSDFAHKLIEALGLADGLPEKPVETDYSAVLSGNRNFTFEAEATYDKKTDQVAIRNYTTFGAFSGSGWLQATTEKTAVHFRIFVPIAGNYTIRVAGKGDDQLWSIAGRAFKHNAGSNFQERLLGQAFIPAGYLEFNTILPPSGAIDYFTLTAPAVAAIEPLHGWKPAAAITTGDISEITAGLLNLEQLLPVDPAFAKKTVAASSMTTLPPEVIATDNPVYGKPVSDRWVRAAQVPATLVIPVTIDTPGIYSMRIRYYGKELTAGLGSIMVTAGSKPFLDWADFGTFRLRKGSNNITITMPPSAGVDVIEISRRLSSPADYAIITKSAKRSDTPIKPEELETIFKSIQEQFKERK